MRVVIDDMRTWPVNDGTIHLRTSAEAERWLVDHRDEQIDELWLDHDLGGMDTIRPVVILIEANVAEGTPFKIGVIYVHSANPASQPIIEGKDPWNCNWRWGPWEDEQ